MGAACIYGGKETDELRQYRSKDVGSQHFHPLTDSVKAMPCQTALTANTGDTIRKNSAFKKRLTTLLKICFVRKTKQKNQCLKKKTAFRSAAVVNIAIELRTAAAQAQGAGSRACRAAQQPQWPRQQTAPDINSQQSVIGTSNRPSWMPFWSLETFSAAFR